MATRYGVILLLAACATITPDEFGLSGGRGDLNYSGGNEDGRSHFGDADTYVAMAHLTWYLGTPVVALSPETILALSAGAERRPDPIRVVVNEAEEAPEEAPGAEILGIPIRSSQDALILALASFVIAIGGAMGGGKVYRKIKKENGS